MYIPKRAPFDLWNSQIPRGLKLYVQRVFIMDEAETFLPLYLRWVKGVVDSSDLPLNVSREMLQESAAVQTIRNALAKRVLDRLSKLANDEPDQYGEFWDEFGAVLKEGVTPDNPNRENLLKLLRFTTNRDVPDEDDRSGVATNVVCRVHRARVGTTEEDLLPHRRQRSPRCAKALTWKYSRLRTLTFCFYPNQ